jgi:hypothetical protein
MRSKTKTIPYEQLLNCSISIQSSKKIFQKMHCKCKGKCFEDLRCICYKNNRKCTSHCENNITGKKGKCCNVEKEKN